MTKITDPTDLTYELNTVALGTANVVVDTAASLIEINTGVLVSDDGVTGQALYSILKEIWKNEALAIPYDFPMEAITPEQFEFIKGWELASTGSVNLIRDAGFLYRDSGGTSVAEYMGFDSVFALNNNAQASGDQVVIELNEPNGTTQNAYITGQANEPVQIYGDGTHGSVDYRNNNIRFFIREQGKAFASSSVSALNVPLPLTYKKYAFPMSNGLDLKIDGVAGLQDTDIASGGFPNAPDQLPFSGMSITSYTVPQSRLIGASSYNFDIIIDGNNATAEQVYAFVQYQLRITGDVDADGIATLNGLTADEMLLFIGDTLQTQQDRNGRGIYIDNFDTNDTNRLQFTDNTGTVRTFPFVSAGTLSFNVNLQNDASASYWVFFTTNPAGNYGSDNALLVKDNSGADITGLVSANATIAFDFDYDGNVQGGRTAGADAAVTVVAIGLDTGQYVKTTAVIGRSVGQNISLVASLERNYSNPV